MVENQFPEEEIQCDVIQNSKEGFLVKLIHARGFFFTRLFLHPSESDSCIVSYIYEGEHDLLKQKEEKWISFLENFMVNWDEYKNES